MENFLQQHHVLVWVFFSLGGASMVWQSIEKGVPRLTAWFLPIAIAWVRFCIHWIMLHPSMKKALSKPENRKRFEDLLVQVEEAFKSILDATMKEAVAEIEAEAEEPEAAPAVAPPPAGPQTVVIVNNPPPATVPDPAAIPAAEKP